MTNTIPNPYAAPTTVPCGQEFHAIDVTDYPLATRQQRFSGAFVDGLVLVVPTIAIALPADLLLEMWLDSESAAMEVAFTLVNIVVSLALFVGINGYLLANFGQTVGKRVVGTQILSQDNKLVPLSSLILARYLPFYVFGSLPGIGGFLWLANALAIFRESRKCLHDDFAKTKVVSLS